MKYYKLLAALKHEPLLITPAAHDGILKLIEEHAILSKADFLAQREGTGVCGEAVELEQAEVIDGIAHIPISGPIGYKLGSFEKGAGAVDVEDLAGELDDAEADPEVRAILLDIDSPGGMVAGTPELADKIASVQKPIYAFSGGLVASAAYWLAAATDGIFLTKSANAGSIGVYAPFLDLSEMAKKQGIRVQIFASGKYKGMGSPGTSLTTEQEDLMKDRVMEIAEMFYSHVRSNRSGVADEAMQGQIFSASASVKEGLADSIVRDKQEVLRML